VIADEPTGNLDPETSLDIMNLLEQINQRGTTILISTHNREIVNHMRRRVIAMRGGELIRDVLDGAYIT
jgi:cell division transport system ATP-binding protein